MFLSEATCFPYLNLSSWYLGSRNTPVSMDYIDSTKNETAVSLPCPGFRRDACYGVKRAGSEPRSKGNRMQKQRSLFPGSPSPLSSFLYSFPFRHCASLEVKHLCKSSRVSGFASQAVVIIGRALGRDRVMRALTSSMVSQFKGRLEDCKNVRRWNPTPEGMICPGSILSNALLPSNLEPNSLLHCVPLAIILCLTSDLKTTEPSNHGLNPPKLQTKLNLDYFT